MEDVAIRWLCAPFGFPGSGVYAGGDYEDRICLYGPGVRKHDHPDITGDPVGLPVHVKGILASIYRKPGQIESQDQGHQEPRGIER